MAYGAVDNVLTPHNVRRTELAGFLRARRDGLRPECVGLPIRARRRTPGLRREEVAELAGISVALYTWLEQRRDVPVSARTIEAVSDALELTEGERRHAQHLAKRSANTGHDELGADLHRMVHAMHATPMLVLDRTWNITLANPAARAVFKVSPAPAMSRVTDGRCNVLDYLFLDGYARRLFIEWELVAQSMLETFRFHLTPHLEDQRARRLVNRLHAASPEFAEYWAKQRIRTHPDGLRNLAHPVMGTLRLEATLLTPNESPNLLLLMFAPADHDTATKIGAIGMNAIAQGVNGGAGARPSRIPEGSGRIASTA